MLNASAGSDNEITVLSEDGDHGNPLKMEFQSLARSIFNDEPEIVGLKDAVKAIAVAERIEEAMELASVG